MGFCQETTINQNQRHNVFKLITCEWLRVKKAIVIALSVHVIMLALLIQFGLFSSNTIGFKMSLVLFYAGGGYLFGITQLKKYCESSQWTYLVNRPIDVKSVYLALFVAALVAFFVVIILPFFTATFILDFWQRETIDLRHYQQLAYILGIVVSFYLVACFTVLNKNKSAHLLLMLAMLPIISLNIGGKVYWLLTGVVIWLFVMVVSSVKVNLNGLLDNVTSQITTAIAYQYALYFFIISLFVMANELTYDIGYRNQEPTNDEQLSSQSFDELSFLRPKDVSIASLYTQGQQYADLIEEIKLNKTTRIRKRVWFHPATQQLPFMDENKTVIDDTENNISWAFSHDLMLFIGKNMTNKKIVGYLGPQKFFTLLGEINQNDLFSEVPWVQNDQIVVKNKVYQYQSNQQTFGLLFTVNKDEYLLNDLQDHGSVQAIITSKHLYIFDSIDYHNEKLPLQAQIVIPLPGDYNNLWDIQITEVIDRFILSFLYGKSSRHDIYKAQQLSYEFTLLGQIKLLNQRELQQSPPLLINDLDYMISPIWKWGLDHFPTHPSRDRYLSHRPQVVGLAKNTYISLLILAIFYAVITLILANKRAVSGSKKWIWLIFNTVLGLPGIFSFIMLNPKKTKLINRKIDYV